MYSRTWAPVAALIIALVFATPILSGCAGLKAEESKDTAAEVGTPPVPAAESTVLEAGPEEEAVADSSDPLLGPVDEENPAPAPSLDPDHVYTLDECIERARHRNLVMDSAKQDVLAARASKHQALTGFLPNLSAQYSYTHLDDEPVTEITLPGVGTTSFPVGTRDNYKMTLTAEQPLFTGFANTAAYQMAKLGLDVAEIAHDQADMDLTLQVKQAYFGILNSEKGVLVAEGSVQQLEAHLKTAQSFFDVGMAPKNQVLEAEVRLAQARQTLTLAEHGLRFGRSQLNILMDRALDAPIKIEDNLKHSPFPRSLDECLETAANNRPELHAAHRQTRVADYGVTLARASYYPTVALQYNRNKEGDSAGVDGGPFHEGDSWDFTAVANWKIWEWGRTRDEVQISNVQRRKAQNALKQIGNAVDLEVKQSFLNLQAADKNIAVAGKAVEQAEENYRMSQERFKEQVATSTEVLDAETLLTVARTNYYRALYDYNVAWAQIERAMGVGPRFARPTPTKE
jgi:outer membrane protein TolC